MNFTKKSGVMKNFFLLAVLFMLMLSCREPAVEKPEYLIPRAKIEAVLYDLAILSSAKGISVKSFQDKGVLPGLYVYEKHQIDSVQFASSIMYYASDPELYIAIQKNVEARLQKTRQQLEETKNLNDSLRGHTKELNRDSLLLRRKRDTARRLVKTQK